MSERVTRQRKESNSPTAPAAPGGLALSARRAIVQPKLIVNPPGDRYEQEADRVADAVLRMSHSRAHVRTHALIGPQRKEETVQSYPGRIRETLSPMVVQRESEGVTTTYEEDDEKEDKVVQAKAVSAHGPREIPSDAASGVDAARRSGTPLPNTERVFFESRFAYDFSSVRIHNDESAAQSAGQLGARAYTTGSDIVFGRGHYEPGTTAGRFLLAHELAHVVQQNPATGRPAAPASSIIQQSPDETRTITKIEVIKKAKIARVTLSDGSKFNLPLDMAQTWIESGDYKGKHTRGESFDKIPESDYQWRFKSDKNSPVRWKAIADSEYDLHVSTTIEVADAKTAGQPPGGKKQGGGEKGAGGGKKGEGSGKKGEGTGEKTDEEKKEGMGKKGTTSTTGAPQITDDDRKALKKFQEQLKASGIETEPAADDKLIELLKTMSANERDDFVRYIKESQAKGEMKKVDLEKMLEFYKKLSPSDRELLRVNLELQGPGAEEGAELPEKVTLDLTKSAESTTGAGATVEAANEELKKVSDELADENLKELAKIHSKIAPPEAFSRENLEPIDLEKIPIFNEMMMFEGLLAGAATQSTEIEGLAKDITKSIGQIRSYVLEEIAWLAGELAAGWILGALLAPLSGGASVIAGGARAAHLLYRLNQLRKFIHKVEQVYTTYSKIKQIIGTVSKVTAAYDKYKVFKARYDELMRKFETLQAQLKTSDDDTLVERLETLEDTLVDELQAQLEGDGALGGLLEYFYIPDDATEEDLRRILYNLPRGFEALKELAGFYSPGKTGDLEYTKTLAFKALRVGILVYPFVGFLAAEVSNRLSVLMQDKTIAERLIGFTSRAGGKKRKAPTRKDTQAKLKEVKKKRPKKGEEAAGKATEEAGAKKQPPKKDDPSAKKKEDEAKKGDDAAKKKADDDAATKKDVDAEKKKDDEEEKDPKKKADAEAKRKADDEWAQVVTKVKALPGQNPNGLTQADLFTEARKISTKHKSVAGGPKVDDVKGEGYWTVKIERKKSMDSVSEKVLMSIRTRLQKGRRAVERAVEARGENESDKLSIERIIGPFKDKYQFDTLRVDHRMDELQGLAVFGKMGSQKEVDIVNIDDVSKLHFGTEGDPIPINFYKQKGNYPQRLNIRGKKTIDRDATTPATPFEIKVTYKDGTIKNKVDVGLDQSNFIKAGDKLFRKSTPRSETKQKDFREALHSVGYDWTGRDADHVKDLAFKGNDSFDNLWPLDSKVNRHAFLGGWYRAHRLEYRDSSDKRKSKAGTLYTMEDHWFKVVGFKTSLPKGYGGKE